RVLVTAGANPWNSSGKNNVQELKPLAREDALHLLSQQATELAAQDAMRAASPNAADVLVEAVGGNPQAMKLLLGLVLSKPSRFSEMASALGALKDKVEEIFDRLFTWSWEMLSDDAERLLLVAPLFVELSSIR